MAAGLFIPKGTLFSGIAEVVKNFSANASMANYDIVNVAAGKIVLAATGERIAGFINRVGAVSNTSTNVPVNITPFMTFIMDNDNVGTTFAATHVGTGFDLITTTAAQIVDTSTTVALTTTSNSAQVVCLEYNPQGVGYDSTTSVGKFMVKEFQFGCAI